MNKSFKVVVKTDVSGLVVGLTSPTKGEVKMHNQLNTHLEVEIKRERGNLSRREMDVLLQIKDGLRNPEIAGNLGLSTKTVENHVRSILQKLGAKNRTEAVVIALKNSMIDI